MTTYILLGGDGYFGRNFQEYLKDINHNNRPEFFIIDKKINYDLNNNCICDLLKDKVYDTVYVINFAAISFVDYSISHPEETISNNFNCCVNGYKLFESIKAKVKKYIYISTDEVRVKKDVKCLSPYVKSKLMCEEYLKNLKTQSEIKIMRPVNLMGAASALPKKELLQQNNCILKIVSNCIKYKKEFYIHGKGTQKRMFMPMVKACELLKMFCEDESDIVKTWSESEGDILDVAEGGYHKLGYRTSNISISNLIYYLSYVYKFDVKEIDDPRGIYQDDDYGINLEEKTYKNDYQLFIDCVEKNLSVI